MKFNFIGIKIVFKHVLISIKYRNVYTFFHTYFLNHYVKEFFFFFSLPLNSINFADAQYYALYVT